MPRPYTLHPGLLASGLSCLLLINSGCTSREEVRKRVEEADSLWDRGDKARAAGIYKEVFPAKFTQPEEKGRILPRIVEAEIAADNPPEARRWIKRGLEAGLSVDYTDPKAKELFAEVKQEFDQDRAEADRRRQKEEAEAARRVGQGVPQKGRPAFLEMGDLDEVWVPVDEQAQRELAATSRARNEAAVRQMMEQGRVLVCERQTRVTVVDPGFMSTTVRILDGKHAGRTGVVPNEFLRAMPRPEPEAPKEEARPPAPPKVEPKKKEAPRPSPPPEDRTVAQKTAYIRIIAALDGVEAAAVKKFGRKPRPDDKAGFTIPYSTFVEREWKRARKELAAELGLDEEDIDIIKFKGDRDGWPKK